MSAMARNSLVTPGYIVLRGVEVHNLKKIDLDLPRGQLIVVCGVSGSGKTSLALDTLYAEGQRRYIESLSTQARQHLQQMEKPAAERIDGVPAAVAVTFTHASRSTRATVATATEIAEHLRLLFAKVGQVFCPGCQRRLLSDTSQSAVERLSHLPENARFMLTFARRFDPSDASAVAEELREDGFIRVMVDNRIVNLNHAEMDVSSTNGSTDTTAYVIVDRLSSRDVGSSRLLESMETAMSKGNGAAGAWISPPDAEVKHASVEDRVVIEIEGKSYGRISFSESIRCEECDIAVAADDPRLYNFNSPLGACPDCEGAGQTPQWDFDLCVPDREKSLRDGALAPWATKTYAGELKKLLAVAQARQLPVDSPVRELSPEHWQIVERGVAESEFDGLAGFFARLKSRQHAKSVRAFLKRWTSPRRCPGCDGVRLRKQALAARLDGKNIAEISRMRVDQAAEFFRSLTLDESESRLARAMLEQIQARLSCLGEIGLSYLSLDRPMRSLSGGEAQRTSLAAALGCSLVNVLYVLDEPSVGLHPQDVERLVPVIEQLRDRGNSVVAVEHEEAIIRRADQVVELGPGAGEFGGEVVFQGDPRELAENTESLTGHFLAGRRGVSVPQKRRAANRGRIHLSKARGNNLKNISVDFPLGMLCVVTGVSGAGKSSLIQDTLYPALSLRKGRQTPSPLPFDEVAGDEAIDEVLLIDQSQLSRSGRSNPVTYIKAFDEIRKVFAETVDARARNYSAGHFSFNVDGGRCEACQGEGRLQIDMQFLPDVYIPCRECHGKRYRREILQVHHRGRSVADVLEMTVREAFAFFRGHPKVQARLKRLIDVGLDYIRLGQSAATLSAGESQRLKLAGHLSSVSRRTLFIMNEPTTGLHFADVITLLDCFQALLSVGHSLIVVEHNLQMMKAADWIIDLGPGAGESGGAVVVSGTPEEVANCRQSATGAFLAKYL